MSFPGSCARYVHTRFESLQGEDDQPKTHFCSIYTDISDAMGALSIRVETLQTVMEWEENQFTAVSLMTKTLTLPTVELVRDVIPCDVLATVCAGGLNRPISSNDTGTLSMANAGPNTNGSQCELII